MDLYRNLYWAVTNNIIRIIAKCRWFSLAVCRDRVQHWCVLCLMLILKWGKHGNGANNMYHQPKIDQMKWQEIGIVSLLIVNLAGIFRCGQETRVIPRILQLRSHWLKSEKESVRLEEAGITKEVHKYTDFAFCTGCYYAVVVAIHFKRGVLFNFVLLPVYRRCWTVP